MEMPTRPRASFQKPRIPVNGIHARRITLYLSAYKFLHIDGGVLNY